MDAIPKVVRVIVTVIDADGRSALYDLKDPISFRHEFMKAEEDMGLLIGPIVTSPSRIRFILEATVDGRSPAYISTYPVEGS